MSIDEGDEVITVTLSGVSGGDEGSTIVHTIILEILIFHLPCSSLIQHDC